MVHPYHWPVKKQFSLSNSPFYNLTAFAWRITPADTWRLEDGKLETVLSNDDFQNDLLIIDMQSTRSWELSSSLAAEAKAWLLFIIVRFSRPHQVCSCDSYRELRNEVTTKARPLKQCWLVQVRLLNFFHSTAKSCHSYPTQKQTGTLVGNSRDLGLKFQTCFV